MTHVAIIGNGITGITAAQRLRELQPEWRITVISGESDYHYSRPALMYIFMGHMRYADTKPYEDGHWKKQRIGLLRAWVKDINVDARQLALHGQDEPLAYDKLLIATGSKSNRFGWPGQDLAGVQGLYGLPDLVKLYENVKNTRHAVIVGGGLIGIELGEMLHTAGVHVTFLVREKSYWSSILPPEESEMVNRLIRSHGFDLRLGTELAEIVDDGDGRCQGVLTTKGDRIDCEIVGLTAGVSPNIDLLNDSLIETGRGVLVDRSLKTNVPNVWAAGDCAEIVKPDESRNLIQQVWYTGRLQGLAAAESMAGGVVQYDPGIWYNSAKFLDLEYQTYGEVFQGREGEHHLWWEHPDGLRGLRIVYNDQSIVGMNAMGLRHRHVVWEQWIRDKRPIEYVLNHLHEANFDPEFYRRFETDAAASFRRTVA